MKILMVNKFLYPNGGSETYILKLGKCLQSQGHEVQYFGMEHEGRIVGNRVGAYTSNMDFHGGSRLAKLTYPMKTIYSVEARKKIRMVLEDFQPDVCHLNNFNYQLTPSIILEIKKWSKQTGHACRIVYTAHDLQLVCPNHLMQNPVAQKCCTKCLGGRFENCVMGRCIHGSMAKSAVGAAEAWYWKARKVYANIDVVVCPSWFLADKLSSSPVLKSRIIVLRNFVETAPVDISAKKDYVLFYGRYSREKGMETLLKAVDQLPDVPFLFAGKGPLKGEIEKYRNAIDKGFLSGGELAQTIAEAKFTVVPSECFENCPFTVMESQMYGTPVLGADIGGIPELIQAGETGELFESGNAGALKRQIQKLWNDSDLIARYSQNCRRVSFDTVQQYAQKLMDSAYTQKTASMEET